MRLTADRSKTVPELTELEIRLLQQERGTRRRAASRYQAGFEQDRGNASGCECVRHQGASHPAADNRHAGFMVTGKRVVPLFATGGVPHPHRLPEPQCLLC
jgi:hypothetical protein